MGHGVPNYGGGGGGGEDLARRGTNPSAAAVSDEGLEIASVLPHVLVVSRRTVRKNKFVDFVGTYLALRTRWNSLFLLLSDSFKFLCCCLYIFLQFILNLLLLYL